MKTFILSTLIAVTLAASTSSMALAGGFVSQSQMGGYQGISQNQFGGYQYQGKANKYNLGGGFAGQFQNTQQGGWQNQGPWQGQQTQQQGPWQGQNQGQWQGQQVPRQGAWQGQGFVLPRPRW